MTAEREDYLRVTPILNFDHPRVAAFAQAATGDGAADAVATAVRLYYAVRDGIWYDPYLPFDRPEHYRASRVIAIGRAFCIGKAGLLCALARSCGIAARLHFFDVRNHLATRQLYERMGTDLFVFHGVTELLLNGSWVKATPAFNRELCRRHRVPPLEFDGCGDSVFQPYTSDRQRFMEYVRDRGVFADIPVEEILEAWREAYSSARVEGWIRGFEAAASRLQPDFDREDICTH